MANILRNEAVTIKYDKTAGKITVTGQSFIIELSAEKSQMASVYLGAEGKGTAKVKVFPQ